MKNLDFTPQWHRRASTRRFARKRTGRLVGLMVLTVSMLTLWRFAEMHVASAALETLSVSHEAQGPIVDLAVVVRDRLDEVRRRELVRDALAGGAAMHQVLAELSLRMRDGVSLTAIEITQPDRITAPADPAAPNAARAGARDVARLNVRIAGLAADEGRVASAVEGLLNSRLFREVELGYSRPGPRGEGSVREFELRCRLPQFE